MPFKTLSPDEYKHLYDCTQTLFTKTADNPAEYQRFYKEFLDAIEARQEAVKQVWYRRLLIVVLSYILGVK